MNKSSADITLIKNSLPDAFSKVLLESCYVKTIRKNETLFKLNENVSCIYFVITGEIQAVRTLIGGDVAIMQRASDGEFFVEAAICVDKYSCNAIATRKSEVICIPIQTLNAELDSNPAFSVFFSKMLAANVRRQCSRLERLRIKKAVDRVHHYLACESGGQNVLTIKPTLASWATELGLEPETLYRTLAELEASDFIHRDGCTITIL